jgi:hypothetical protein
MTRITVPNIDVSLALDAAGLPAGQESSDAFPRPTGPKMCQHNQSR